VDQDIRTYVHERVRTDRAFQRWNSNPAVQDEIETELMQGDCTPSHLLHGADVNAPGSAWNGTALRGASENGHSEIVELLLENDANSNDSRSGAWHWRLIRTMAI
jgi:hypothetical protein